MKDSFGFRLSGEGELEFTKAVAAAKKWIGANVNGPVKLGFSIGLKLSAPEGESIQEVLATEPMFQTENGTSKVCKRCKVGHHADCKRGDCTCTNAKHESDGATV